MQNHAVKDRWIRQVASDAAGLPERVTVRLPETLLALITGPSSAFSTPSVFSLPATERRPIFARMIGACTDMAPETVLMSRASKASSRPATIIPLTLVPERLRQVIRYQPFAQALDAPIRMYLHTMSAGEWLLNLGVQLLWLAALWALSRLLWRRNLDRIVIQGG